MVARESGREAWIIGTQRVFGAVTIFCRILSNGGSTGPYKFTQTYRMYNSKTEP